MFLLDTNIWVERLLDQKRSLEVDQLLKLIPRNQLSISDFSLHSIGVILFKKNLLDPYLQFYRNFEGFHSAHVATLSIQDKKLLVQVKIEQSLDFDDSYQYVVAKTENLHLVSFDQDFDKTDLKRLEPLQALELWKNRATA